MDHCGQCGFVYADHSPPELPAALRRCARHFRDRLLEASPDPGDEGRLRAHPAVGVWSALEYACHVRDVLVVQRSRLRLALEEERPVFTPMGREERVVQDRYNEQDPRAVAEALVRAGDDLANDLEALDGTGWDRVGVYNWPEPAERTLLWLARHTLHELSHHLEDFDRAREAATPGFPST